MDIIQTAALLDEAAIEQSYPLHVTRRRGRWLIIDGIHRLVKADLRGDTKVTAHPVTAAALRQAIV